MCRLLGAISSDTVNIRLRFRGVPRTSPFKLVYENPDAVGVASYSGDGWRVFKSLVKESRSGYPIGEFRGRIVIVHVRNRLQGELNEENIQPLKYGEWIFAHHGLVDRVNLVKMLRNRYLSEAKGRCGSKALFCLILQEIEDKGDFIEGLRSAIDMINRIRVGYTSLNFIASNGRCMYALRYSRVKTSYYIIYYMDEPGGIEVNRVSEATSMEVFLKSRGRTIAVASESIGGWLKWPPLPNKHLIKVDENLNLEVIRLS